MQTNKSHVIKTQLQRVSEQKEASLKREHVMCIFLCFFLMSLFPMCFLHLIVITWEFEFFIERFLVQWLCCLRSPALPLCCSAPQKGCLPSSAPWPARAISHQHLMPYEESKIMIYFFLKPKLLLPAWGKQSEGREGIHSAVCLNCWSLFTRPEKEKLAGCCQCTGMSSRRLSAKIELSSEANLHGNYFRSLVLSLCSSV